MKAINFKTSLINRNFILMVLLGVCISFNLKGQTTTCPGPWPTSGGVGQPGNWIVIGNTSNGNDPSTGYGNVSYQYSYLDRFVRLSEYVTFLNAVDPGGSGGYVGNLVNVGMIQYAGGWQVAPFTSCASETGQSMTAAQTGQIAVTLISFNLCARFCNWLTSGSVSTGPYTFSSSSPNATPTSVNINYPNSVRMPTEDEFYKAAYYRASNATWRDYGTQDGNLSAGEPIVSGVSSTGIINISNGHLYNQSFHWHPTCGCGVACLWQIRAGQGGQSYYNLYNMVGGFHHYLTSGGSSTTMILRHQNQVQGGAPEQSRYFRLTGADPAEHYASPSLHLVYYGDACCPIAGTPSNLSICDDNFTSINLFDQLTDEDTGGTWTRTVGTGGTFNAAAGTFLPDATTSATSTFRYTISASGSCAASTADVTITIITKKYAGTGGSAAECTNSGTVVSLASLLTGADTGGTWTRLTGTGGTFSAAVGTYTITSTATTSTFRYSVTNTAPCTTSDAVVTVNVANRPTVTCAKTDVSNCATPNGTATATATGVTYAWSNGGTTAGITGLSPGTYTVTVTSTTTSCTATCSATVGTTVTPPTVTCAKTDVADCATPNGTATATATGVTYAWSNGGTTAGITGLSPGTYTVTVTSTTTSCTATCSAIVGTTVTPPTVTCAKTDVSNCATPNGTATATATGVTYAWSNGGTTAGITGLSPGTYTMTVTSTTTSCTATCSATVGTTVTPPTVTCAKTDVSNCATPNGTATATATGVTYAWSNGGTTAGITGLLAGSYTVTVTSTTTGCTATCSAIVGTTVTPPIVTCAKTDVSNCATPNGTATATATGVTYNWSNGGTTAGITGLSAGSYTVTVTSTTNSCTATCSATVLDNTLSNLPTCSISVNSQPTCASLNGGSVTVIPSPPGSYSYLWDNGTTTATNTNLSGGTFTVTVTDMTTMCTGECQVTLDTPTGCCNIAAIVPQNLICFDNGTPNLQTDNKIRFSAMVSNSNALLPSYNVAISGGTTITPNTGISYGTTQFTLGPGTAGGGAIFTITVTDSATPGCTQSFQVTDPGSCLPGTGECPPVKCGTATIQVNGN